MKLPVARIGDTSSHNGKIITSCMKTKVEGKLVARVNDMHQCPIEGHGTTPIKTGSPNHVVEGMKCARTSSITGCGASIIGGSMKTFCD
jgi:uncharacterized Zn-binding protein involved in type VI secretion